VRAGERISVVIPAHDGLPDLIDAVQCVLSQTRLPHEIIVVDDASSDGGGEAVERRFGDSLRAAPALPKRPRSTRTEGEWIAFLDADDLWLADKLAVATERLQASPHADWFFSDGAFRTLDGQLHASWFGLYADVVEPYCGSPVAQLFEVNFVLTSSTVVRRAALERENGFDESLTHAEDLDLWVRLSRRGLATASRRALVRYQHREGGLTRQTEKRLEGGARLFDRLAADRELTPELRRLALRRASLYHYKLALAALRQGRRSEAISGFVRAWLFPERVKPVLLGLAAAFLPNAWFAGLRRQGAARAVATPLAALRRVRLEGMAEAPATPGATRQGGQA